MDNRITPAGTDVPGGFPATPSTASTAQRIPLHSAHDTRTPSLVDTSNVHTPTRPRPESQSYFTAATMSGTRTTETPKSANAVATKKSPTEDQHQATDGNVQSYSRCSISSKSDTPLDSPIERNDLRYQPPTATPSVAAQRPGLQQRKSIQTEDDLFNVLSRRRTNASGKSDAQLEEENDEIERLMSRMFGKARQEQSEEEKTRHSGVVFRNLTVKGVGLGASLQPTVGDIFMGLARMLKRLVTKGPTAASGKPPVRELLSNFDGCVRPGEMLLVLGRPGAGCSTFLKAFCNQREGFESVEGDVTYGGADAKRMKKDFRGEVIYNPEDDLHYPTLSVKRTLTFALQTRTPGKESRMEGESRTDYMREFLRVVTKLFWIEHTLGTKVGDAFVRGVSGGEKKRVSIAEGKQILSGRQQLLT